MKLEKRYVMIVTAEDDRYGSNGYQLDYWANNPWDGDLIGIIQANDAAELESQINEEDYEGLFYVLYDRKIRRMIGNGCIDGSYVNEIQETVETLRDATYTSVWEGGVRITAECRVDMVSKEVFDIDCSVSIDGILDGEFVTIRGEDYPVSDGPRATIYWYK